MQNTEEQLARLNDAYYAVIDYLVSFAGSEWTKQNVITAWTGVTGRTMRQVCQLHPSMFIGSTEGYKLASRSTRAEIQHTVATLLSRAEKITHRAAALSGRLA